MDIDLIVNDLIEGLTYRQIAKKYNKSLSTLHDFTSRAEHSARVKMALEISAQASVDSAEEILLSIKKTSNKIEMARARELSQFYKWKAAKRNPQKYGDKPETKDDTDNEITVNRL